jgi:hypothetical protein
MKNATGNFLGGLGTALMQYTMAKQSQDRFDKLYGDKGKASAPAATPAPAPATTLIAPASGASATPAAAPAPVSAPSPEASATPSATAMPVNPGGNVDAMSLESAPPASLPDEYSAAWKNTPEVGQGANPDWAGLPESATYA